MTDIDASQKPSPEILTASVAEKTPQEQSQGKQTDRQLALDLQRRTDRLPIIARDPTTKRRGRNQPLRLLKVIDVAFELLRTDHVCSKALPPGVCAPRLGTTSDEMLTDAAINSIASTFPPTVRKEGKWYRVVQFPETVLLLQGRVAPDAVLRCILDAEPHGLAQSISAQFVLRMFYDRSMASLGLLGGHANPAVLKFLFSDYGGCEMLAPLISRLRGVDRKTAKRYLRLGGMVSEPEEGAK